MTGLRVWSTEADHHKTSHLFGVVGNYKSALRANHHTLTEGPLQGLTLRFQARGLIKPHGKNRGQKRNFCYKTYYFGHLVRKM